MGLKLTHAPATRSAIPSKPIVLEAMDFPEPVISVAIEPKTKADEEKLGLSLCRLASEDPTFRVTTDAETGQTLIYGMGELHLEIIVDRLLREFRVEANVGKPQVAYRETIRRQAEARGASSARPAGAASTATCTSSSSRSAAGGLRVREQDRGAGPFPREYIPAVEKGVRRPCEAGILAGYPDGRRQGPALTTARTTRSTPRRWRSRSPAPWPSRKRAAGPSLCCWSP